MLVRDYRLVPVCVAIWIGTWWGLSVQNQIIILVGVGVLLTLLAVFIGRYLSFRKWQNNLGNYAETLKKSTPALAFKLRKPRTKALARQFSRRQMTAGTFALVSFCGLAGIVVGHATLENFLGDPATVLLLGGSPDQVSSSEHEGVNAQQFLRMQVRLLGDFELKENPWGGQHYWAAAQIERVQIGEKWFDSSPKLYLDSADLTAKGKVGDRFVVFGSLSGSQNKPGSIVAPPFLGIMKIRSINLVEPASGWQSAANRLRAHLDQATSNLPTYARGLIAGMAVGDDHLLDSELSEAMLTASLTHLTAVSGSHIAITVLALGFMIPAKKGMRQIVVGLFLAALLFVVGPQPSVTRAVATCYLVNIGRIFGRGAHPISSLAIVVMLGLLLSPWSAKSLGFSLSVVATWGILFSALAWQNSLEASEVTRSSLPRWGWQLLRRHLQSALVVSLAASLWVLPITVTVNPWIPLWGVLANMAVTPAVAPLTVLSLLAAAISPLGPQIAEVICYMAVPFAWWIKEVSVFVGRLPLTRLPWPDGLIGVVSAVVLVGMILVILHRRFGARESMAVSVNVAK